MTPSDNPSQRGAAIRVARLARIRLIRRRVVAGSVALFVALWLLIAVTLVSGHDPALASQKSSASSGATTTTTSTGSGSGSGTSSSGTSSAGTSSSGTSSASASNGASSSSGLSAVTTSQS